jgi:hypothetical protein
MVLVVVIVVIVVVGQVNDFFSRVFFHWLCPEGRDFAWYRNWDATLGLNRQPIEV